MSPQSLRYSHWYDNDASFSNGVLYWRTPRDWQGEVFCAGCLVALTAVTGLSVWGLSARITQPIFVTVAAAWLLVGVVLIRGLIRYRRDRSDLIVDCMRRTVVIKYWCTKRLQSARFEEVDRLIARHEFNGRILDLEFVCKPEASIASIPDESGAPIEPNTWNKGWELEIGADEIASWIGCPVKHDYTGD